MLELLSSAAHLVLALIGLAGVADPSAVGLAVAVVAVALVALTIASLAIPEPGGGSAAHPRRAIDISTPLSQSDPDASGHPRPRAPQHAASAA